MSQKQTKFNRGRLLRENKLSEGRKIFRRPLLFSTDDVDQMRAESSRAKLIRHLASKPAKEILEVPGEFSSYYYRPQKLNDVVYSATSHSVKRSGQLYNSSTGHRSVVPTYPSLTNNLRWDPDLESTSVYNTQRNDSRHRTETSNTNCRCIECVGKHCRAQSGGNKPRKFRDNITRFADCSTMTPKLNDASCGSCTPVNTYRKTSDASVSSSDVAVRETHCARAVVSQVYLNSDPVSILKKKSTCEPIRDYEREHYDRYTTQTDKKCRIEENYEEAVRDNEDDFNELDESPPLRSFPKIVRSKSREYNEEDIEPRKNIYNEGISDMLFNLLPNAPHSYHETGKVAKTNDPGYSKTPFVNKVTQKSYPSSYEHESESKYHYGCVTPQNQSYYGFNHNVNHQSFSKKFKKTFTSKPLPNSNVETIKYPRKVLTSERDIESYIESRFMKRPH